MRLDDPLTEDQKSLAADHWADALRLAGAACRRWPAGPQADDVATRGLMNAVRAHDPARPLKPLLARCVAFAWSDLAKAEIGKGAPRPKAHHYGLDGDWLFASGDDPVGAGLESEDAVEWMVGLVGSSRQREVVRRMHLDAGCAEVRQVARRLGLSPSVAHLAAQRGRASLAAALAGYGAK